MCRHSVLRLSVRSAESDILLATLPMLLMTPIHSSTQMSMLDAIFQFEQRSGIEFAGFILHDSEDVLSRLELRLFNFLVDRKDLIQLPVYPLERPLREFTGGHYLDEFAELHAKDIVVREALVGQVPSAGVGTCFSRRAITALLEMGDGDVAQGTVRAFQAGVLDVPWSPNRQVASRVMPARDADGGWERTAGPCGAAGRCLSRLARRSGAVHERGGRARAARDRCHGRDLSPAAAAA